LDAEDSCRRRVFLAGLAKVRIRVLQKKKNSVTSKPEPARVESSMQTEMFEVVSCDDTAPLWLPLPVVVITPSEVRSDTSAG
jgi:hypothetical protein